MLERTAAWLINHVFSREGSKFIDDVVAFFTANEKAAHGSRVADPEAGWVETASVQFPGGEGREIRPVTFARVVDGETVGAEGREEDLDTWDYEAGGGYVILLVFHVASWRADC